MSEQNINDLGLTSSEMLDLVEQKLSSLNIKITVGSLELSYGGFMALVHVGKIVGDKWGQKFEEHFIGRKTSQSMYLNAVDEMLKEYSDVDMRNRLEQIFLRKMKLLSPAVE